MSIIEIKYLQLLSIFGITIVGCVPIIWKRISNKIELYIYEADAFARGIFLGAGITHLLPAAIGKYIRSPEYSSKVVIVTSAAAISIAVLTWVERSLPQHFEGFNQKYIMPLLLIFALSFHSFIEGYALGFEYTVSGAILIFIAIISHKGLESLALSLKLAATSSLTYHSRLAMFFLFAIMTPLGIIAGIISIKYLNSENNLYGSIAEAIAAGTFIYIATMHSLPTFKRSHHISGILFILGIFSMSILGYLFTDSH